MKKLLIFSLFFLLFTLQVSGADGNTVCKIPTDKEKEIINALEKLMFQHFIENTSNLPLAQIKPEHEHFKNNPDVFAFYSPNDNYIYFKDKDIVNKLNDKYILNSVIHELTHFYQNNYGNKLPAGGPPSAIARLMIVSYGSEIKNFKICSISEWEKVFKTTCNNIDTFRDPQIVKDVKDWLKQFSTLDIAWNNFLRGCIADGCACTMGVKNSSSWKTGEKSVLRHDYIYVYIPVFITYMTEQGFEGDWKKYFKKFSNFRETPQWWLLIASDPTESSISIFAKGIRSSLANITNKQILKGIEKEK